jgi:hypothetical protein
VDTKLAPQGMTQSGPATATATPAATTTAAAAVSSKPAKVPLPQREEVAAAAEPSNEASSQACPVSH